MTKSDTRKANRLIHETSPYLLQHAYNPVDWYPWSEEAFTRAKEEDKPVLLSIGYSTCHWCHVMERESFEDEVVADFMNKHFICIKLDREERPDLDHIYMDAVQAMTGQGGWPLNIFLTPDKIPFYGGTYFPPKRVHGRPAWIEVLKAISQAYETDKSSIVDQTRKLLDHLNAINRLSNFDSDFELEDDFFHKAFNVLRSNFDKEYGGYSPPPKFPSTYTSQFLLHYFYYFKNDVALEHCLLTVKHMIRGGIYDQIRGGLCRYSTDAAWIVPHFEKMLYDNANFLELLCDVYRITGDDEIITAIRQTTEFILSEFLSEQGLFYSAYDADSDGVEGKYYCWTYDELKQLLADDFEWFVAYYHIEPQGNWEHTNILHRDAAPDEFARRINIPESDFREALSRAHQKLISVAEQRIKPSLDFKHITSWNAMMIKSLLHSYIILKDNRLLNQAEASFSNLTALISAQDNNIWHQISNNKTSHPAVLEDYAALIGTGIILFTITGNSSYLNIAEKYTRVTLDNFFDEKEGLFHFSHRNSNDTIINKFEIFDNVICSGNSWMLSNLIKLNAINPDQTIGNIINKLIKKINHLASSHPASFSKWLTVMLNYNKHKGEIIITGKEALNEVVSIMSYFKPDYLICNLQNENDRILLQNKYSPNLPLLYFICEDNQCRPPSSDMKKLHSEFLN